MNITASVKKNDAGYQAVMAAIKILKNNDVFIGVPENTATRKDGKGTPINNAELLFIHTNGSPVRRIPPRPVLEPAVIHNKERLTASLQKAIDAAVNGDSAGILPALEQTGMDGQNVARDWFTNSVNEWPKNAQSTIDQKGSENPLIDTGEMRKAITYVVREVKK